MHMTFMSVLLILCATAAYYLIRSLVWTLPLRRGWKLILALPLLLICFSFPAERAYGDDLGNVCLGTLLLLGGSLTSLLFFFCVVRDVILLPWVLRKRSVKRAQAILAPLVVLLAVGGCAWGYHSAYDTKVVEVEVPLPSSCAGLEDLRIVQISDTHVTKLTPPEWLDSIVAQTNALKPDIICITGDIADLPLHEAARYMAPLKELKAKHGVYYVDGNHEYFTQQVWLWHLTVRQFGFISLNNSNECFKFGGKLVQVAGIPDSLAEKFGPESPSVVRAIACENGQKPAFRLLLSHRPQAIYDAAEQGVHLTLAGHTHGGQFFPWNILVALAQPHFKGLYREGDSQLYVNQGTGFWAIPNRLGTTSEITLFKLKPQLETP